VGAAFGSKKEVIDGHTITLGIWDTAGAGKISTVIQIKIHRPKPNLDIYFPKNDTRV
jgi:hypothetical protein